MLSSGMLGPQAILRLLKESAFRFLTQELNFPEDIARRMSNKTRFISADETGQVLACEIVLAQTDTSKLTLPFVVCLASGSFMVKFGERSGALDSWISYKGSVQWDFLVRCLFYSRIAGKGGC